MRILDGLLIGLWICMFILIVDLESRIVQKEEREKLEAINSGHDNTYFVNDKVVASHEHYPEYVVAPELYPKYDKRRNELIKKFPNADPIRLWNMACAELTDKEVEAKLKE